MRALPFVVLPLLFWFGCRRDDGAVEAPASAAAAAASPEPTAPASAAPAPAVSAEPFSPRKVDLIEPAMGTEVHFVAYTAPSLDEGAIRGAMTRAHAEIVRVESVMTSWRDTSEIGRVNLGAGTSVGVSDETITVLEKSRWAGDLSGGVFDITFHAL